MPLFVPSVSAPLALNGLNLILPDLNPTTIYEVLLTGGANTSNASWIATTSQNANGSSPDAGVSDYRWSYRALPSAGTVDDQFDDADARIVLINTVTAQFTGLLMRILFDPGNGIMDWTATGVLSTGVSKKVNGGGYINKTNTRALILGVSAGVALGTVYIRPLV